MRKSCCSGILIPRLAQQPTNQPTNQFHHFAAEEYRVFHSARSLPVPVLEGNALKKTFFYLPTNIGKRGMEMDGGVEMVFFGQRKGK